MAAPVSVCHVACCANRVGGGAVSWGREGLLAFGSCRDVILYQPAVSGVGRRGGAGLAGPAWRRRGLTPGVSPHPAGQADGSSAPRARRQGELRALGTAAGRR